MQVAQSKFKMSAHKHAVFFTSRPSQPWHESIMHSAEEHTYFNQSLF